MIRKKLIEVGLPLDEINAESKREKSIRHGHPSTLHLWWARRPLAACRAVIFASMVDDPSSCPDEFPTKEEQSAERKRLHGIIRKMLKWETTDESKDTSRQIQLDTRYEIARSVARSRGESPPARDDTTGILQYLRDNAPPVYDPFAGGGSIPLEAQRLGLLSMASDLNPVAVLINKALIELPPKFSGRPPVNPDASNIHDVMSWRGASGLANDIRYYGNVVRDEALQRIGHLYPKVRLSNGKEATVIAWLWTRTVPCPNPACGITMPLITTFQLSKKRGNEHWARPVINKENKTVSFVVQNNDDNVPKDGTVNRNGATCIACKTISPLSYVREQSKAGNMGEQMTAIVAQGDRKRLFLSPTDEHIRVALSAKPNTNFIPQQEIPTTTYKISGSAYGITHWHELFTNRQLAALATLSDLIPTIRDMIITNSGADKDYADTICTFLSLAVGRCAHGASSFGRWRNTRHKVEGVFALQAIPMVWDFAEANTFSTATQNWMAQIVWIAKVIERLPSIINGGKAYQADASTTTTNKSPIIVTDPPYYDNISYAELSDFFYVWLRPLLRKTYPKLFSGILVPKQEEMIAAPRFEKMKEYGGSKDRFRQLMSNALRLISQSNSEFPSAIFYAYKQQEEEHEGTSSTGWDTMLSALVSAGLQIVGTWPMRTELSNRSNALGTNALASSIILVCRERPENTKAATRREFVNALKTELPKALRHMQDGNIAPVDLAQAAIGPGMSVFTQFSKVLDADGNAISVRDALILINQTLDEVLTEQEGDFDADSRWALSWFKQYKFDKEDYGIAETLSKAKNTSVHGLVEAGILESGSGKVRLLRPQELPENWDPTKDQRFTVWEATHHLVRVLDQGESVAADMMAKLGHNTDAARELAYRLYHMCNQKNLSQEAQSYNALIQSWPEISQLARTITSQQESLSTGMKLYDDR